MKCVLLCMIVLLFAAGVCAEDGRAVESSQVIVEGQAPADSSNARELAVADALRNAVMKRIGVYVESTTLGRNYQVVKEEILLKASGFATLDSVEKESVGSGLYKVVVKATVSNRPLAEKLKALGMARAWKVGVCLNNESAELAVIKRLLDAGYRVVDDQRRKQLAKNAAVRRAAAGDTAALSDLSREFDVDILILGEANASKADSSVVGGVTFYRYRGGISARAYYTDTGDLITVLDKTGEALEQTEPLALSKCLDKIGDQIGTAVASDIAIVPPEMSPYITVKISGLANANEAASIEKCMRSIPGIQKVSRRRLTNGVLEIDVTVKSEYVSSIAESIESSSTGKRLGLAIDAWSKAYVEGRVTKHVEKKTNYTVNKKIR